MESYDWFSSLESNKKDVVDDIKQKIQETFLTSKDPSLLNGLYDYYLVSNSLKAIEILVCVREPNDKYLMDKLCESMKGATKMKCLNLLGHLLRRQPSWIFKIAQHQLMKDLLKLLKFELDILPLMSALLSIIILLPMIPAYIGPFLYDIFQIFSRLAAWNSNKSGSMNDDYLIHLQVALYALFLRLYGMYPNNFISYLRTMYRERDHASVFSHTIKPMLDTVRMHSSLVTATKDSEVSTTRWMRCEQHDIIVQCEKFTVEIDRGHDDLPCTIAPSNFRSRSNSCYSLRYDTALSRQLHETILNNSFIHVDANDKDYWSPSMFYYQSNAACMETSAPISVPQTPIPQINMSSHNLLNSLYAQTEDTSPPETAIEATPDINQTKDSRPALTRPPISSNAVRALNPQNPLKWTYSQPSTPITTSSNFSQPSSPMRMSDSVVSPFRFPTESNIFDFHRKDYSPAFSDRREFQYGKLSRIMQDRCQSVTMDHDRSVRTKTSLFRPCSPLRIISASASSIIGTASSTPNSPIPIDDYHLDLAHSKVQRNSFPMDTCSAVENLESSQEDQEVLEIVRQGELQKDLTERCILSQCDSSGIQNTQSTQPDDDFDECMQEESSPCTSGGLHMPNSRSMLDFARRVTRLRFYSQCCPDNTPNEPLGISTGSASGSTEILVNNSTFRRAKSCPEMKKGTIASTKSSQTTIVYESNHNGSKIGNEDNSNNEKKRLFSKKPASVNVVTSETQTEETWPMPYEHLFLNVYPPNDAKLNTSNNSNSSPAPDSLNHKLSLWPSPYDILDKYIENAANYYDKKLTRTPNSGKEPDLHYLRDQLGLVHLQLHFERYRREVHAVRNRRLLGETRSNRVLEEHNAALQNQSILMQRENETLQFQLGDKRNDLDSKHKDFQDAVNFWKKQFEDKYNENVALQLQNRALQGDLIEKNEHIQTVVRELQELQGDLFDKDAEIKTAMEQLVVMDQLKTELQRLQKEVVLMGEVQLKYEHQLSQYEQLEDRNHEISLMDEAYQEQIKRLNAQLEAEKFAADTSRLRIIELENVIRQYQNNYALQESLSRKTEEEFQAELQVTI